MTLLSSFKKVKGACVTSHLGTLSHVLVTGGWMWATDSRMTAAAKVEVQDTFMAPGAELEKALTILGEEHKLKSADAKLVLTEGNRRVTISTLDPSSAKHLNNLEGDLVDVSPDFKDQLRKAAAFMSDDQTKGWACAVRLEGCRLLSTNNVSLISVDVGDWAKGLDVTLPDWLVNFVLGRDEPVTQIAVGDRFVCFRFEDSSWVRSTRLAQEMPDNILEKMSGLLKSARPDFELSQAWKDAWRDVVQLADEVVTIAPDHLLTGKGQAQMVAEVASPVEEATVWHPKFLGKVISVATHFDPRHYPAPAAFKGEGLHGVIAGKM